MASSTGMVFAALITTNFIFFFATIALSSIGAAQQQIASDYEGESHFMSPLKRYNALHYGKRGIENVDEYFPSSRPRVVLQSQQMIPSSRMKRFNSMHFGKRGAFMKSSKPESFLLRDERSNALHFGR